MLFGYPSNFLGVFKHSPAGEEHFAGSGLVLVEVKLFEGTSVDDFKILLQRFQDVRPT